MFCHLIGTNKVPLKELINLEWPKYVFNLKKAG